jgi:hypothetical protein
VLPGIAAGGQPRDNESWEFLRSTGKNWDLKLNTWREGFDGLALANHIVPIEIPFTTYDQWHGPTDAQVAAAVAAIEPDGTFVHCGSDSRTRSWWSRITDTQGGQDRTWFIMGVYLVRVQHWSKADAYALMRSHGYHPWELGLQWYWNHNVEDRIP